jgi:hypothetical protein
MLVTTLADAENNPKSLSANRSRQPRVRHPQFGILVLAVLEGGRTICRPLTIALIGEHAQGDRFQNKRRVDFTWVCRMGSLGIAPADDKVWSHGSRLEIVHDAVLRSCPIPLAHDAHFGLTVHVVSSVCYEPPLRPGPDRQKILRDQIRCCQLPRDHSAKC